MTEQLESCRSGHHDFEIISEVEYNGYSRIIKWCCYCGTVAFYTAYDGRHRGEKYLTPLLTLGA